MPGLHVSNTSQIHMARVQRLKIGGMLDARCRYRERTSATGSPVLFPLKQMWGLFFTLDLSHMTWSSLDETLNREHIIYLSGHV